MTDDRRTNTLLDLLAECRDQAESERQQLLARINELECALREVRHHRSAEEQQATQMRLAIHRVRESILGIDRGPALSVNSLLVLLDAINARLLESTK